MSKRPYLREVKTEGARRSALWKCPVCTAAGHTSGPLIEVVLEAQVHDGVITPGERGLACLACHQRGVLTIVA